MKKSKLFSLCLAALLATSVFTSCDLGSSETTNISLTLPTTATTQTDTTTETNEHAQDPQVSAQHFAEKLDEALKNKSQFQTEFQVKQKYSAKGIALSTEVKAMLQADCNKADDPQFHLSIAFISGKTTEEARIYYNGGYAYINADGQRHKSPDTDEKIVNAFSVFPLKKLIADEAEALFASAEVKQNDDGSLTATTILSTSEHLEKIQKFLYAFSDDYTIPTADEYKDTTLSVMMNSDGTLLSYEVNVELPYTDDSETFNTVNYAIHATENAITDDFSIEIPSEDILQTYYEKEPEITEISIDDFKRRFSVAEKKAEESVGAEQWVDAQSVYYMNGMQFEFPTSHYTALNLADEEHPIIATMIKQTVMGVSTSQETYYKDGVMYLIISGQKLSVQYPYEEFKKTLEDVSSESEDLKTIFLDENMLSKATFTIHDDQSVTAEMIFDGKSQKDNILYHIETIYDEDFGDTSNITLSENTIVTITLNAYNDLTEYTLDTTLWIKDKETGQSVAVDYVFQYQYQYYSEAFEIDLPADIGTDAYTDVTESYHNGDPGILA